MNGVIQVPIKEHSERIKDKNFLIYKGKPLYAHLLDRLSHLSMDVYIDSESERVFRETESYGFLRHKRNPIFSSNTANGNHLLTQFAYDHLEYDYYVQLFVTSPHLTLDTIQDAIATFHGAVEKGHDSLFTATTETGFYWYEGQPINYDPTRPKGLFRSQDCPVIKETTGLYIITKDALLKNSCRVGENPYIYLISPEEAKDINDPQDIK